MAEKLKLKNKLKKKSRSNDQTEQQLRSKALRKVRRKKRQDINRAAKSILKKNQDKQTAALQEEEERLAEPQNPHAANMQIHTNHIKNKQLAVWDSVPVCTTSCVAWEQCPKRIAEDVKNPPKCIVRVRYITSTLDILQKGLVIDDDLTLHKVGMMLIPLYSQLCSFKIAEIGMNKDNRVLHRGKINPIYKEMRSTIQLIDKMLTELNYTGPSIKGKRSKKDGKDKETYGDRNYYKTLLDEDDE